MASIKLERKIADLENRLNQLENQNQKLADHISKLERSRDLLKTLTENLPLGLLLEDASQTIMYLNQTFCRLFALPSPENWIGRKRSEISRQGKSLFREPEKFVKSFDAPSKKRAFRKENLQLLDGRVFEQEWIPLTTGRKKSGNLWIYRDITDQKRSEKKLEENGNVYREFAEMLPQVVFETDDTGKLTFVNRNSFEIFGYTEEEFNKGLNYLQMLVPEDRQRAQEHFRQILQGAPPRYSEYMALRKDGSTFPIEIHSSLILKNKKPAGLRGFIVDISARKKMEERVSEYEARYRAIFERSPQCVYIHDFNGNFLDANDASLNLLGYTRDEIKTVTFSTILEEDQLAKAYQVLEEVIKTGHKGELTEYRLKKKNGERVWVEADSALILKKGKPDAILGIARDITQKKLAEQALSESEEMFRSLVETSPDLIIQINKKGKIEYVSPRVTDFYGYEAEELVGKHFRTLTPPGEISRTSKALKQVLAGKILTNFQINQIAKSGKTITIEVNASPVKKDEQIVGVQAILRDISERKQVEEALQENQRLLTTLLSNLPGMAYRCNNDPGWTMEFVSQGCYQLTGYKPADLLNNAVISYAEVIHPEDRQMVWDAVQEALKKKKAISVDLPD